MVDVDGWLEQHEKELWELRGATRKVGMYALVTQIWTKQLASWIGKRKVLEVMAGKGWLAKALDSFGVDIVATDDNSWSDIKLFKDVFPGIKPVKDVFTVERYDACAAIEKYKDRDILLLSWPPYDSSEGYSAIKAWGPDKPIIYIGEGYGGCTADDAFHEVFEHIPYAEMPELTYTTWNMLHDTIHIGYYNPERTN